MADGYPRRFLEEFKHANSTFGGLKKFFPLMESLSVYKRSYLWREALAGIIVACFHIPQSMGTGMAANLGPVYGIYLTFFPGVIYALLGSSRHNSVGAFAPSAALVGVGVARTRKIFNRQFLPNQTTELVGDADLPLVIQTHLDIAVGFTLCAGTIQLLMTFLRLEFLGRIFPFTVLDAFNCACSLQIMLVQIPNMFGVKLDQFYGFNKHISLIVLFFQNAMKLRWMDTLLAILTASITIGFREFLQPKLFQKVQLIVPIEFILMSMSMTISYALDLSGKYDVRILGKSPMPSGLEEPRNHIDHHCLNIKLKNFRRMPHPSLPSPRYMPFSLFEGFLGALVSIAFCMQATRPASRKHGYKVDLKQELIALGSANIFSSFFSCFIASSNIGRSSILDSMGARSQLSTLVSCTVTGLLLAFASKTLYYLPSSVIATIITLTLAMSLKLFEDLPDIWRSSKLDAVQWILTFASCILLDLEWGLLIGMGISLLRDQLRSQQPQLITLQPTKAHQSSVSSRYKIVLVGSAISYSNVDRFVDSVLATHIPGSKSRRPTRAGNNRGPSSWILNSRLSVVNTHIGLFSSSLSDSEDSPDKTPNSRRCSLVSNLKQHPIQENKDVILELDEKDLTGDVKLSLEDRDGEPDSRGNVILDCTLVTHIDAAGVRSLNYLMAELVKKGTSLWFASCSESTERLLKRTKCSPTVMLPGANFVSSVDEAIDLIEQEMVKTLNAVPELSRRNVLEVSTQPAVARRGSQDVNFWGVTGLPDAKREVVEMHTADEVEDTKSVNMGVYSVSID
ncbi:hypothetical protein RvY_08139 [Ramazzottius varieornatus]|uniref:STAS domain-containing protein n=1 Tax=Ramazzottius varieornatus TaxID=947166 RepID=A0A1D1V758_RAMVA|nr:hypothetical protein RvY_08139 [Ramazzottius varieornatus]